jgi:capsular polysaccharide biosynthesis protein
MQFQTYLNILRRRGWILALLMVLTAGAAFGYSRVMLSAAPVNKSTIKILVQPATADFGVSQTAKVLLDSYVVWMNSDYRAADVINTLKLDMTPSALRSDVTIASDAQRLVIQIDVENRDGNLANDIAREWANLFIAWRNQQNLKVLSQNRIEAQIIDDPRYELDFPKTSINTAAGAVMGLLLGLVIVFILEYIESGIVRTPEDVDRMLTLPVLGSIPPLEH